MWQIDLFLSDIRNMIWSTPLLLLLMGTGIYLTFILRGVQFRYLGYAFKQIFAPQKRNSKGDINPFEALMTSLAGAIGTGTIVGVATAIMIGGLGAIFWMWVTAFISMATKYAESLLAVKYREMDGRGEMCGGPMHYMEKGLNWKGLAYLFAALGIIASLSTGNLVQANSIATAIEHVWHIDPFLTGIFLCLLTALVILGGVKSIGRVAGILVPLMAIIYIGAACYILIVNFTLIPTAFLVIIKNAWQGQAAVGGFAGATMVIALQMGVSRSVFSNEAGLGISSLAAAAAKTDCPSRQALVTMTGALISTVIICTMTGLVLAISGLIGSADATGKIYNGAALAIAAFNLHILWGEYLVTIGLVLFAYTTVIAWAFYGEKCCEYLFGERSIFFYRILYALVIIPGAVLQMETAWQLADISNGLMIVPNLIALICLSGVLVRETKTFLEGVEQEKNKQVRVKVTHLGE